MYEMDCLILPQNFHLLDLIALYCDHSLSDFYPRHENFGLLISKKAALN